MASAAAASAAMLSSPGFAAARDFVLGKGCPGPIIRIDMEEDWEKKLLDDDCTICTEKITGRIYWTFTCGCRVKLHESCGDSWILGAAVRDKCIQCGAPAIGAKIGEEDRPIYAMAQPSSEVIEAVNSRGPILYMSDNGEESSEEEEEDDAADPDWVVGSK